MKQLAFEFAPAAVATLGNFVAGRNAELLERLCALASPDGRERFVYLWGAPGSGRTHLLRGALAALSDARWKVSYVAAGAGPLPSHALADARALAVDDVERLDPAGEAALFNAYNRLREEDGILLAAGASPAAQLDLRPDLVTRLAWGLAYAVHGLTDGEKAHALAEHAAARGFGLPPDVCQYLLTRVQRDMRALVAMLDSLDRYSRETKRPITVPLIRELVSQ